MPTNFRIVLPNQLYRSGQIAPSEINSLVNQPYNVRKIVSLDQNAGNAISKYIPQGIEHIMFPLLEGNGSIEARSLASAIKQGLLETKGATLVHCMNGQDRSGLAIALYRVIKQGWTCTQAIQEAISLGYGSGLNPNILGQYNIEICRNCQVSHTHYCQNTTTTNGKTTNSTQDVSQVDDIVSLMKDDFSHSQSWPSAGVMTPSISDNLTFAPFTDSSSEGALGAKSGSSKARKSILKKILKFIEDNKEELKSEIDDNSTSDFAMSGQIDNYGGSNSGNAPSGTPGSPNSAAFTADPTGLVQI
jgi:hypothetical protein